MARSTPQTDIWVAKEGFFGEYDDGSPLIVTAGERVRDGHPMLKTYGNYFEPVDTHVHYDVEQATAAPGEKRGPPPSSS